MLLGHDFLTGPSAQTYRGNIRGLAVDALIEKIADNLPGGNSTMTHTAKKATLVRGDLTSIPINQIIIVKFVKQVIKAIDKILRAFLWKGCKKVNGGHCLVAWVWV